MTKYLINDYVKSKDAIKSPLRYPGGKFYALKHIMPYIQCVEHDEFREPFFGSGAIFFAKQKVKYNIINDLESDIMDFYRWIKDENRAETLIKRLDKEVANRERHQEIKDFEPVTELDKVFKTYYLNRTSYSGIINHPSWGYEEGKSSPPQNWGNFIRKVTPKLHDVDMYSLDFTEILEIPARGKTVMMYLDPPYYHADTKRAYTKPFNEEDHKRLSEALKKTKYLFCLSYDDCPEIRELYKWAKIYDASWQYNTANSREKRMIGKELIITNYEAESQYEPSEFRP